MSHGFNNTQTPLDPSVSEVSIRQLIVNGKFKTALDRAKELHKARGTAASESLLIDAYAARIESLIQQNLVLEAKSLIELVQERFPSSKPRLQALGMSAAAHSGALDELVKPLTDPNLSLELRSSIEQSLQNQLHDLSPLAACPALPPEHPLRQAASALQAAFVAVTSGPVAVDALALPEVSHRSPLAPWKLFIRAIGCFYRNEDDACRDYLEAIKPESTPARLIPAIRAMLTGRPAAQLTPASSVLVAASSSNLLVLRTALEALDQAFNSEHESRILQAIRNAVSECRLTSPGLLEELRKRVSVRCVMADLDERKVTSAMGGTPVPGAHLTRLLARALERSGGLEDLTQSCVMWDQFKRFGIEEGWLPPNGAEVAALYLHMAGLIRRLPAALLADLQKSISAKKNKTPGAEPYFLFPEILYQRAVTFDPHFEAFSQWLDWAKQIRGTYAETVADCWHSKLPLDLEPILFLLQAAAGRSLYHTALKHLAKAEQIDSVHPTVRRARLRLMTGSVLWRIKQKKFRLAEEELAQMSSLPQTQQGDRPAVLAALRYLVNAAQGRTELAAAEHAQVERLLESRIAAELLIFGAAEAAKRRDLAPLGPVRLLDKTDLAPLSQGFARVVALFKDVQGMNLFLPLDYMDEVAKQISRGGQAIDTGQLLTLAEAGMTADHFQLAYAATSAGLEHGGVTEVKFLLLRSKSLPKGLTDRRMVCAAAAVELARQRLDMELVADAVQTLHQLAPQGFSVSIEEAVEVIRKEKQARTISAQGTPSPDYSDLFVTEKCQCPECRRRRGEEPDFDDDELDSIFGPEIPPDMPPEIAQMLYEETAKAVESGESLEDLLLRLQGGGGFLKKKKKGKRK